MSSVDKLIRKGEDPILATVCDPVQPGEHLPFLDLMERVCRKAKGAGLAAPQVGFAKRVIFLLCPQSRRIASSDGQPVGVLRGSGVRGSFMINPVILDASYDVTELEEACLSYPGMRRKIQRHASVLVRYEDARRVEHEAWVFDFEARVVQHEVDHLNGICKVGQDRYAPASLRESPSVARRVRLAAAAMGILN